MLEFLVSDVKASTPRTPDDHPEVTSMPPHVLRCEKKT